MDQNMSLPFLMDGGNVFCKVVFAQNELMFPHALAELTREQWDYAVDSFGAAAAEDFVRLGNKFYVVGDTASNYQFTRLMGRPKYTRDYYGVLFASAIGRVFEHPKLLEQGLTVHASHPTDDFEFRKELTKSIKGEWKFEAGGKAYEFTVTTVKTYEESFGGYLRRATHWDGQKWTTPLRGYDFGTIDLGGGTCGVLAVDKRGFKQTAMSKSGTQGVQGAIDRLRQSLQRKYSGKFARTTSIPEDRLRSALQTGVFNGFGESLDCAREAELAVNPLLNEVKTLWQRYLGAGVGLDGIVLTGGGNGFLSERVMETIERDASTGVILADSVDDIQFANVRGARDFADFVDAVGLPL